MTYPPGIYKTTEDPDPLGERVEELETKLSGLAEHVDGRTDDHLQTARERFERYRECHAE